MEERRSYKLYRYQWPDTGAGEYWHGVSFTDFLNLTQYETILPVVIKYLPKQGKILDAGYGTGRWLLYLRKLGYDITGLDISEEALRTIRSYDNSIPVVQGDVEHTQFGDGAFTAIISLGVVEHFEKGGAQVTWRRRAAAPHCTLPEPHQKAGSHSRSQDCGDVFDEAGFPATVFRI